MAPLVIILPTVVVVIVLAVALGLRHIKKGERADLASDRPVGRGRAGAGQDDEWRAPRQRPAARGQAAGRSAREDHDKQRSPRSGRGAAGRGDEHAEVVQLKGRPDARAKQAKSKRSGDDEDWPSTEWDDLSDADYWKEVASDRPLVTMARTAAPESPVARPDASAVPAVSAQNAPQAQNTRQAQDAQTLLQAAAAPQRDQEPRRSGRESRRDRASHDSGLPDHSAAPAPSRGLPQRAAAGAGAGYGPDYLGAPPASPALDLPRPAPYRPAAGPAMPAPSMPAMPAPAAASMAPAGRPRTAPPPLDDDPLTSPSFPKIVTSDSRSYHSSRSAASSASAAASSAPAADRAGYSSATTSIFPRYGSPALRPGGGEPGGYPPADGSTAPHSYAPASPGGQSGLPDGYDPNGYDPAGPDASYSLPSQPSTSYDSSPGMVNGYGHAGPGHGPAGQETTAAYASPSPQAARYPDHEAPPAAAPAGNPYGSYVTNSDYMSTDLPGYSPSLASAYPPGQPAASYLPSPPAGRASDPYGHDYPPAAATPDSWYPPAAAPQATGGSGSHRGPAGGGEPAPAGYPAPTEYGQPGYSGRHHDAPSYIPAGYDGPGSAPSYLPPGGHPAAQQDTAAYLPPDYYGRDGLDDQPRW